MQKHHRGGGSSRQAKILKIPPPPFIELNLPSHVGVQRVGAIREKDLKLFVQAICLLAVFDARLEQLPKTKTRLSQKKRFKF